jgi:hypothetical protein
VEEWSSYPASAVATGCLLDCATGSLVHALEDDVQEVCVDVDVGVRVCLLCVCVCVRMRVCAP